MVNCPICGLNPCLTERVCWWKGFSASVGVLVLACLLIFFLLRCSGCGGGETPAKSAKPAEISSSAEEKKELARERKEFEDAKAANKKKEMEKEEAEIKAKRKAVDDAATVVAKAKKDFEDAKAAEAKKIFDDAVKRAADAEKIIKDLRSAKEKEEKEDLDRLRKKEKADLEEMIRKLQEKPPAPAILVEPKGKGSSGSYFPIHDAEKLALAEYERQWQELFAQRQQRQLTEGIQAAKLNHGSYEMRPVMSANGRATLYNASLVVPQNRQKSYEAALAKLEDGLQRQGDFFNTQLTYTKQVFQSSPHMRQRLWGELRAEKRREDILNRK